MINIEILINGSGCSKCQRAEAVIDRVIEKFKEKNIKAVKIDITKDPEKLFKYEVTLTPAIVINKKLVFEGAVKERELEDRLNEEL